MDDQDIVAKEDQELTFFVYAEDTQNDTIRYSLKGPGGKIDQRSGKFEWTPRNSNVGRNVITFIAEDEDGGISTLKMDITVEDVDNDIFGLSLGLGLMILCFVVICITIPLIIFLMRRKGRS